MWANERVLAARDSRCDPPDDAPLCPDCEAEEAKGLFLDAVRDAVNNVLSPADYADFYSKARENAEQLGDMADEIAGFVRAERERDEHRRCRKHQWGPGE